MIWVLSGTSDGNVIIGLLKKEGHPILASTVTEYGASLAKETGANEVLCGALDAEEMAGVIEKWSVTAVVDATHPFAIEASKNAIQACRELNTRYVRYERPFEELPESRLIHGATSFEEASGLAAELGDTIFYTAGSKNLEVFLKRKGKRLIAKVLPDSQVIAKCINLGMPPNDIIALQGGNGKALLKALMEEYSASVLVTKESGKTGGLKEKVLAALELGIPVVVIKRPPMKYPHVVHDCKDVIQFVR